MISPAQSHTYFKSAQTPRGNRKRPYAWRIVITSRLAQATIATQGKDYLVRLTTDDGASFELVASFDQLDTLAEDIDRRLDADEDGEIN